MREYQIIKKLSESGRIHKDKGRRNESNFQSLKIAHQRYKKAAILSLKTLNQAENKQIEIYAYYYYYESNLCKIFYHIALKEYQEALALEKECLDNLSKALNLLQNNKSFLPTHIQATLNEQYILWNYYLLTLNSITLSIKAKLSFIEKNYIESFDLYTDAAKKALKQVEYAENNSLDSVYLRISKGNYLGMKANLSSSFTGVILKSIETTEKPDFKKLLLIKIINITLEAYKYATNAYDTNPEWEAYLKLSEIFKNNLEKLLLKNKKIWRDIYLSFETEQLIKEIMKKKDPTEFNKINSEFKDNKLLKLWSIGSFFLLAFIIIISGLTYVNLSLKSLFQFLITVILTQTILLTIGALMLRTLGDLSETNFMTLIRFLISNQFKLFKFSKEDKT
ncbi:hypothetical protein [Leptospira kanakyensis]|uniref:hypothetical protein n=1 Tax=Leptospira kanakyensis TaxID=2484968 RepID=UPI00223D6F42|nr:hypothetical protein [Leptospira kanakyensis]MCW7471788.1 hypothetical protein [Leptospira kanakyensis]